MTDRPIPFIAPMVCALLDGRKTQTRRALKFQPDIPKKAPVHIVHDIGTSTFDLHCRPRFINGKFGGSERMHIVDCKVAIGDRLWVREAWRADRSWDMSPPRDISTYAPVMYEADVVEDAARLDWGRYRHARFMPRWASRLTLLVNHVRVQRLEDISDDDAIAEGILKGGPLSWLPNSKGNVWHSGVEADLDDPFTWSRSPRQAFCDLWNSIHGEDAWWTNPWVCAATFTVHRCNIDHLADCL